MNLDYRSVPYRVFERGYSIIAVFVLSFVVSPNRGSGTATDGGSLAPFTLPLFILVGLGFIAVWETAYVKRYEYRVTPDTFDISSGVFSRREREIPFERIQNVDVAQNVFQRFLGIAEVRLETAGGGDSEARLRYVSRQEATRLQELVSDRKRGDTTKRDPDAPDNVLFELDNNELAILGFTSANFGLLALIFVMFVVLGTPVAAEQVSPRLAVLLILGPVVAAVALVLMWVVSGVRAVLRYYGFRLVRHEDELRYQRGLLQQYNGTIPLSKIQTVMIRENIFARAVGYGNLAIETAGYAPGQGNDSVESAIPIAKLDRLFTLARTIEDVGEITFERPPKRARIRYVGRYTIVVGLVLTALGGVHLVTGEFGDWYLGVLLWVLVPPAAHLKWTHLGYYYDDDYIVTRSGFWTRRTTIVPYYRVQMVSDSQTIFQQRRGLGTLSVDTASSGGFWGGTAVALDIDIEDARELREQTHDRFQWALRERHTRRNRTAPGSE
jgi:putative membrane protein